MRSMWWLVVLVASCGHPAPSFERRELPGFSLDVPTPLEQPGPGAMYDRGSADLRTDDEVVSVIWGTEQLGAEVSSRRSPSCSALGWVAIPTRR